MTKTSTIAAAVLLCMVGATLVAQNDATRKSSAANKGNKAEKPSRSKPHLVITPEREAAVTAFLRRHQRELLDLVLYLKEHLPKEYERAVRDIYRTHQRLSVFADRRETERHDLELRLWKNRSRVQLLSAQYRTSRRDEIRRQIEGLLKQQHEIRIMLLKHDRKKFVSRLEKLDQQIEKLQASKQQSIERQVRLLTNPPKTVPVTTGAAKKPAKPKRVVE